MKFKFIDSSTTYYGIAKQLESHLISLGHELSDDGITFCYANDIGPISSATGEKISLNNSVTLRRAYESKADYRFYSQRACSEWFIRDKDFFLPSAINDDIFNDYKLNRNIDVGFVGKAAFLSRKEFIKLLNKNGYNTKKDIYFKDLAKYYNQCKIVANHSVVNEVNMRIFEATSCGALLITQKVPYLDELFTDKEIVTYETYEEMLEKIDYYLKHYKEREKISKAGQNRTLSDHTYKKRVEVILKCGVLETN